MEAPERFVRSSWLKKDVLAIAVDYDSSFDADIMNNGNCFVCDDCSVEEARARNNGGRVEKTKFSIGPYGFISLVYDTEGNMIGLHSMK